MALDVGAKGEKLDSSEKQFSGPGHDPENATGRRMSRIDKPLDSDTDSSLSVGKQIEMEASNAIKYRSCSWPKVCLNILHSIPNYAPSRISPLLHMTVVIFH
jgi:hypothetical protein